MVWRRGSGGLGAVGRGVAWGGGCRGAGWRRGSAGRGAVGRGVAWGGGPEGRGYQGVHLKPGSDFDEILVAKTTFPWFSL